MAVLVSIGCSVAFQEATEFDEREQAAREATSPADLPMPEGGGALPHEGGSATPPLPPKRGSAAPPLPPEGGSATAPIPEPSPTRRAPTEQTEFEGLKRCGWSDDEIAARSPAMRRREFQEAMETVQSGPIAEMAPGQENPSKPAEGAPRTRQTKDLSGKLIYGGLGVILLCAIFDVVFKQRDPPWLKVHNETGAEVLRWFDYDEKNKKRRLANPD